MKSMGQTVEINLKQTNSNIPNKPKSNQKLHMKNKPKHENQLELFTYHI